jgi:hypothetical protein
MPKAEDSKDLLPYRDANSDPLSLEVDASNLTLICYSSQEYLF